MYQYSRYILFCVVPILMGVAPHSSFSSEQDEDTFTLGRSFFNIPWVEAPAVTTARDGLGPLFNANTCISCHPKNGGGTLFNNKNLSRSIVIRLGKTRYQNNSHYANIPDSRYGGQIQINGVYGVPFEAKPMAKISTKIVTYPDGKTTTLHRPHFTLTQLQYGSLDKDTQISARKSLRVTGLGMIAKIPEQDILQKQDIADKNHDGISGKANFIFNPKTQTKQLGRFNWKASAPDIYTQSARAAFHDMGLSNPLFTKENCSPTQIACLKAPQGTSNKPNQSTSLDLPQQRLLATSHYLSKLSAPQTPPNKLFITTGCAGCHTPHYKTDQDIYPYSDFLLHDMGADLSDKVSEFLATGTEWRTPPLWGMRYDSVYLHDGRANTIEQAILWHGGEARNAKDTFMQLPEKDRHTLLHFLSTL